MSASLTHVSGTPAKMTSTPHLAVQTLGLVLFAGFAIVSTVMAFVMFWPAGFALALGLAWFGFRPLFGHRDKPFTQGDIAPIVADPATFGRRNASFAAYRQNVLQSLEEEQTSFDGFLARLREAKDAKEFDAFMEDRVRMNADAAAARARTDDEAGPSGGAA